MVCTVSAGTAAPYYISEQSRYYTGGHEPSGRWFAPSASANVIDSAEIHDATFERLHAGLDSEGNKLTQNADGSRADRVAGYDLTFSAPKSVSVIWGLGDSEQRKVIEEAHDAAVRAALGVINHNAAFSRRGKAGVTLEPVQLTGAIFQHGEARPTERETGQPGEKRLEADPQLHSHTVIFNWAQRADGSWGSVDGRHLFRWKMAAGAVYRTELAARLVDLGYVIEKTDEKGLFEIAGVPKPVRDAFSDRRLGIVAAMLERGLETADAPALAASVTKASRKSKSASQESDRHKVWRARAVQLGFKMPLPDVGAKKPERCAASTAEILARLTETKAVFRRQDIFAAVAADLVGVATAGADRTKAVTDSVKAVLQDAELVSLGTDPLGQPAYSTREMLALERGLEKIASNMGRTYFGPMPAATGIKAASIASELSEEQQAAYKHACGAGRLAIVEGAAGSGKTTMLSAIAKSYQMAGYEVIGSAVAWRAAQQLGTECGIESRALDSWLASHGDRAEVFTRKTVLIVDEAGLLSTRQMHAILSAAQAGGTKVILAGDQRQLQAIGAGSGLAIIASQVSSVRVDTNHRQKEAWARTAISQLARGQAEAALQAFDQRGCLHWAEGQKAVVQRALDIWRTHQMNYPRKTIAVLAKSNADVRAINLAMRAELRQIGQIRGNEIIIPAVDRSGVSFDLALARGDRVEITRRHRQLGVVNGTNCVVTWIEPDQKGHARLTVAIGSKAVTFSTTELTDARGRARLGHAYATTIYNAQGLTVDRAIIIGNPSFTANQAYVATSRARERTDIIIDRREIEKELRSQARALGSMLPGKPSGHDLISHLAKCWGRVGIKERVLQSNDKVADQQLVEELGR